MSLLQRARRRNRTKAPFDLAGKVLRSIIGALAVTLALVTVACGDGADKVDSPTTLSPLPAGKLPTLLRGSSNVGDVFNQLHASEQRCIRDGLEGEAYNHVLQRGFEDDLPQEMKNVLTDCLGRESMIRLVIGVLSSELGVLDDATVECLKDSLADANLTPVIFGGGEGIKSSAAISLTVLFCLTDEETARADAKYFGDGGISITQMRCVTEVVDISDLLVLDDEPNLMSSFAGELHEVLQALLTCGVEIPTGEGEGPDFTSEQFQCLQDALGPDIMRRGDTGMPPSDEELAAFFNCGVEIPTGEGEGPDFTSEQFQCLLDALGPDSLQRGNTGMPPSDEELAAFFNCGVGREILTGEGAGPDFTSEQLQCLLDALGPDFFQKGDTGMPLSDDELAAFEACGMGIPTGDIPNRSDVGSSKQRLSHDSPKQTFTDRQLQCLQSLGALSLGNGQTSNTLGVNALKEITSGERTPTIAEIQALLACSVELHR